VVSGADYFLGFRRRIEEARARVAAGAAQQARLDRAAPPG
jgi:hypothetical protein